MKATTYQQELRELHHHRVYYITALGGLLVLVFAILDYIVTPEYFYEFLGYRFAAAVLSIFLFTANYFDKQQTSAALIGMAEYLLISFILLLIIYRMDGGSSPYYVGLIVVMTVYSTMAPLTEFQSVFSGLFIICCYALIVSLSNTTGFELPMEVFGNLFFMICFVFIIATQSWAETRARKKEFHLRQKELKSNKKLNHHIAALEKEVEKRTMWQKATEKRYRLLFDQIADDAVLLSPDGIILHSNRSFSQHYLENSADENNSFFQIVSADDQQTLKNLLNNTLSSGKPVRSRSLLLIRSDGSTCTTEINISSITRGKGKVSALLVIRDISIRKHLEKQLFNSLKRKEETENSAIMSLAKLSEYRDFTPKNHLERIREYCRVLAEQLSRHDDFKTIISFDFIHDIYHAAILHDIGKVSLPDDLIHKSTPFSAQEEARYRRHTIIGGDVIEQVESGIQQRSYLSMAKNIAYFHHEHWDGTGYPSGLKEDEIPVAARIMAVVDTYEELTTAGAPNPNSHEQAIETIFQNINIQFDPRIAEALYIRQDEFIFIKNKFPPN